MAKVESKDGKSYKEVLKDTIAAASKMIDKTASVKKVQNLINKESQIRVNVESGNE